MKKLKRITATLLAMLTALSFTALAACNDDEDPDTANQSKLESSLPEEESSGKPDDDPPVVTPPIETGACTDTLKGHDFVEGKGVCIRCEQSAPIPTIPDSASFPIARGEGSLLEPVDLEEGYHTLEFSTKYLGSSSEIWVTFFAEEIGQFVLYTVDGANGVAITEYPSIEGSGYVNESAAKPAEKVDGNLYSYINRGAAYGHANWRATYRITAKKDAVVKLCFARIGAPAWEPENIRTKIYATEINGKAAEGPEDLQLTDVPYNSEYYYSDPADGGDGYYHLGTPEEDKGLIYVAINKQAKRLFESGRFTDILKNAGTALNLYAGKDEIGNNKIYCYTPFIMNWVDEDANWIEDRGETIIPEADPEKIAYQNFCNSDGVHPVNKELYEFLNLYVQTHKPIDDEISASDFNAKLDWIWLAACYYYTNENVGFASNPLILEEGLNTITLFENDFLYCTFEEDGYYTLSSNNAIDLDYGAFDLRETVKLGTYSLLSEVFRLSSETGEAKTVTVNVTRHLDEELSIGNIPVELPSQEKIMLHGTLQHGEYKFSWDNEDVIVTINGKVMGIGVTEYVLTGEEFNIELNNYSSSDVSFTFTTVEKGLEVGDNAFSLGKGDVKFINFYGETQMKYNIFSAEFEIYSVSTNEDNKQEIAEKIDAIEVPVDGYVTIAVVVPDDALLDSDGLLHGTITFTQAN